MLFGVFTTSSRLFWHFSRGNRKTCWLGSVGQPYYLILFKFGLSSRAFYLRQYKCLSSIKTLSTFRMEISIVINRLGAFLGA